MTSVEYCRFNGKEKGETCKSCGYFLTKNYKETPIRVCGDGRCGYRGKAAGTVQVSCGGRETSQTVVICEIHGRCLPHYRPNKKKWEERHESSLYHLCYNCKEFKAKE